MPQPIQHCNPQQSTILGQMMYVPHGGFCCGVFHVFAMGNSPNQLDAANEDDGPETKIQKLNRIIEHHNTTQRGAQSRILEVILSPRQHNAGWPEALINLGFVESVRWVNGNTGRECRIFYLADNLVFQRNQGNDERRPNGNAVIKDMFYASFRNGNRSRWFETENEVRETYPRCRTIMRARINAAGNVHHTEVE